MVFTHQQQLVYCARTFSQLVFCPEAPCTLSPHTLKAAATFPISTLPQSNDALHSFITAAFKHINRTTRPNSSGYAAYIYI
jgi:hypothetical protein